MDKKQVTELVVPIAAVLDLEAQGKQDFAASDITQNLSPPEPKPGSGETQFPPKITKSGAPTELRKLKDGSEKVDRFIDRYDPFWEGNRQPNGSIIESSILDSLHHANIGHLRSKLLTLYICLESRSAIYQDVEESILKQLHTTLISYTQAERDYHDWRHLSHEEQSSQNECIHPENLDLLTAQAAAILECATIYDLDEEKGTLVGVREKVKERQRAEKDYPRPTVTKRSLRRRIHLEGLKSKERFTSRALAAIFGGLAVIVPMLIMSLHPTRLTQLLTASIFVVSVALILAWVMDEAERKDIIAATAAYGAVLVVFVGASATTT